MEGAGVDITKLPICTNNPNDGGQYITAGHVIIRDPEYGNNLAIYRMMVVSKNEVTIRFTPGSGTCRAPTVPSAPSTPSPAGT